MADFYRECSIDLWGEDTGDLAGLSTKEDTDNGLFCVVLCETCGVIQVDHEGVSITPKEENIGE